MPVRLAATAFYMQKYLHHTALPLENTLMAVTLVAALSLRLRGISGALDGPCIITPPLIAFQPRIHFNDGQLSAALSPSTLEI